MSKAFENSIINGMELQNRFVRSATWEGLANSDGTVTNKLIDAMVNLAGGGVGLIITGHSYVQPEGQAGPWQLGVYKDELIPGLQKMADAVHQQGGKIVMQLAHAGKYATELLKQKLALVVSKTEAESDSIYREITVQDIKRIVDDFAAAARRAKIAGFDGVQIHAGHGYLLSQSLSPLFNRRQDKYGGDIHNRSRMVLEVYNAVRNTVGTDYPIFIKLNCQDFVAGGLSLEDSIQVGRILATAGIDAIELSGGIIRSGKLAPSRTGINSPEKEAYYREQARQFKQNVEVPLILVGGIRSFAVANRLLEDEIVHYISMCRPFICEPGLIKRWKTGDYRTTECKSDNLCLKSGLEGTGVYCLLRERRDKSISQ